MSSSDCQTKILHVHPTRRCNLSCLHCYSSSGPDAKDELSFAILEKAILESRAEGFTLLSVSGGEPGLYKPLPQLLDCARQVGMDTVMVSNGMLLDERRLALLKGRLDLLAISLDGMPASHNRMRNHAQAFETMCSRLPGVQASGIPFGFLFTLTHQNYQEFDWVVDFALAHGAKLLQIHPLEAQGRAKENLSGISPNGSLAAYAYLKVKRLHEKVGDRLHVQLDLTHQLDLRANPQSFFADGGVKDVASASLSDLISPLIIEPDGTVVPLQYGFARQYALGNLLETSLKQLGQQWRIQTYPKFLALCRQEYEAMSIPRKLPVMDWYAALAESAEAEILAA